MDQADTHSNTYPESNTDAESNADAHTHSNTDAHAESNADAEPNSCSRFNSSAELTATQILRITAGSTDVPHSGHGSNDANDRPRHHRKNTPEV